MSLLRYSRGRRDGLKVGIHALNAVLSLVPAQNRGKVLQYIAALEADLERFKLKTRQDTIDAILMIEGELWDELEARELGPMFAGECVCRGEANAKA